MPALPPIPPVEERPIWVENPYVPGQIVDVQPLFKLMLERHEADYRAPNSPQILISDLLEVIWFVSAYHNQGCDASLLGHIIDILTWHSRAFTDMIGTARRGQAEYQPVLTTLHAQAA